jgi:hypothetical protein
MKGAAGGCADTAGLSVAQGDGDGDGFSSQVRLLRNGLWQTALTTSRAGIHAEGLSSVVNSDIDSCVG